jgi:hypothetical protein
MRTYIEYEGNGEWVHNWFDDTEVIKALAPIQTITIPNDIEVSTEFYEWFTANAVEQKTIKAGTYRFNDVLTKASFYNEVFFDFQTVAIVNDVPYTLYCNTMYQDVNEQYDSASLQYIAVSSIPDLSELGISFPLGRYVYDGSTKEWRTDLYGEGIQTITITNDTEVSADFYDWFTANATQIVGAIPEKYADVNIYYNNQHLLGFNKKDNLELLCKGKLMKGSIVFRY